MPGKNAKLEHNPWKGVEFTGLQDLKVSGIKVTG